MVIRVCYDSLLLHLLPKCDNYDDPVYVILLIYK